MGGSIGRSKLPLTQLQAFEAVARLGTFKAATDELGGSNVSKHVAALEASLGVVLISRKPRGILTREGAILSAHLTRVFDQTDQLLKGLQEGRIEDELLIAILSFWPR